MSDNGKTTPAAEPAMYNVKAFCLSHGGINVSTLYRMWAEGRGPRYVKVGKRTLIPAEAAREWRAELLAQAAGERG